MSKIWILNASPIIVIGKAGLLETVSPIARNWLIPEGVFNDISQKGEATQYVKWLSANAEVEILVVPEIDPIVGGWNLGRGESEVLTLAVQKGGGRDKLNPGPDRKVRYAPGHANQTNLI